MVLSICSLSLNLEWHKVIKKINQYLTEVWIHYKPKKTIIIISRLILNILNLNTNCGVLTVCYFSNLDFSNQISVFKLWVAYFNTVVSWWFNSCIANICGPFTWRTNGTSAYKWFNCAMHRINWHHCMTGKYIHVILIFWMKFDNFKKIYEHS